MKSNNMTLSFSINSGTDNDYAYVHIRRFGAKVCLNFPRLNTGEKMERYDSYYEAERAALRFNARKNEIDENNIVLATVDTSVIYTDDAMTHGLMAGAFVIKDSYGNILDEVIYKPEDNNVCSSRNLNLTEFAEVRTAIYMLHYIKERGYENVIINHDNKAIKEILHMRHKNLTMAELNLIREMRNAYNQIDGKVIFQHLKAHTGHRTLDYVDGLAKNANKENKEKLLVLKQ